MSQAFYGHPMHILMCQRSPPGYHLTFNASWWHFSQQPQDPELFEWTVLFCPPGCCLTWAMTQRQLSLILSARWGPALPGPLFSQIHGWGICRLANGGCSVLPNVNGVKCDHFADKCKQVSFWLAVEIIPQFCNLGTIDFVDVDYSISSSFQWYSDSFNCSFQVICVWCFLISSLMIDTANSMPAFYHLITTNESVRAVTADTSLVSLLPALRSFFSFLQSHQELRGLWGDALPSHVSFLFSVIHQGNNFSF